MTTFDYPVRPVAIAFNPSGTLPLSLAGPLRPVVKRGLVFAERGQWALSYEAFSDAVRTDPEDLAARCGRVRAAAKCGKEGTLRLLLNKALQGSWMRTHRTDDDPPGIVALWYEAALSDGPDKKPSEVERTVEAAMAARWQQPGKPDPRGRYGWPLRLLLLAAHEKTRIDRPERRARLRALIKEVPEAGLFRAALAMELAEGEAAIAWVRQDGTHYWDKDVSPLPKEARIVIDPLLASLPKHPYVRFAAGRVSEAEGKTTEAIRHYDAYLTTPDAGSRADATRREVLRRLDRLRGSVKKRVG